MKGELVMFSLAVEYKALETIEDHCKRRSKTGGIGSVAEKVLSLSRENVRVQRSAKMSVTLWLVSPGMKLMAWPRLNWLSVGGSSPAAHPQDFGA
jgi:hypothetical protein